MTTSLGQELEAGDIIIVFPSRSTPHAAVIRGFTLLGVPQITKVKERYDGTGGLKLYNDRWGDYSEAIRPNEYMLEELFEAEELRMLREARVQIQAGTFKHTNKKYE